MTGHNRRVSTADLHALCAHLGIALTATDASGITRTPDPETLCAVAAALTRDVRDTPLTRPDQAPAVWRALTARATLAPDVVVAWGGEGTLPVDRAAAPRAAVAELDVELEDGTTRAAKVPLTAEIALPALPFGMHRGRLQVGPVSHQFTILSAPPRTWRDPADTGARGYGLFAPLYGIGRTGSSGVGDLRDLRGLSDLCADQGGRFVGTLPLLCASYERDAQGRIDVSPYAPLSRLFFNELYLDLEATDEWARSRNAKARFAEVAAAWGDTGPDELVDPAAAYTQRWPVLEALAETYFRRPDPALLDEARAAMPHLDDYVRYRKKRDGAPAARVHLYAQAALHRQLTALAAHARDRGVSLYLDLPVGSHGQGYDATRFPQVFATGLCAGAPPDALFAGGQNWGFAPFSPRGLRQDGYRFVRDMLQTHCRYAGILRLDHVMWLHRIYCVPEGRAATEGVYVHMAPEELWAVVCLVSHQTQTEIAGEDLGTVPDEVTAQMTARRATGMHLVQFGLTGNPRAPMIEPRPEVLASLGTHDTPTFPAFVEGSDIGLRIELGHQSAEDADRDRAQRRACVDALAEGLRARGLCDDPHDPVAVTRGAMRALAQSPARTVVVSLDDVLGKTAPQNVPGTCDEMPNWRRRAAPIDALCADDEVKALLSDLDQCRRRDPVPLSTGAAPAPVRTDVTALSDTDVYLWNEGTHRKAYDALGAHVEEHDGVRGVRFAVWAPDATAVAVAGDFNGWQDAAHALGPRASSGIWEGFVPGAAAGDKYKFRLLTKGGERLEKADPFAFASEEPPANASVVASTQYDWEDGAWMATRAGKSALDAPVSIYELHLGSWRRQVEEGGRFLSYREAAASLADHIERLGFTHVELMPVMEHPFYGSWGYQVTGYFAPTARYGRPEDLMALVDTLHQRGIGVVLDWVPSHFPEDGWALAKFDGTALFEHADPRLGFHPDWKSCIFNYGRHEVQSFLVSSALWWVKTFHVDGLRVDGVASMLYRDYSRKEGEWIPNEHGGRENLEAVSFLRELNSAVYGECDGVQTYAEESTAWPGVSRPVDAGGLGFGYKWDMGWMNDTLSYFEKDPIHRSFHHNQLTFRQMYAYSENYVLALSHDEVVHGKGSLLGKMPGDDWQKFANLRLLYGYMFSQPGKKLLFMGGEFGQWREWNHEQSLDWHLLDDERHQGLMRWVAQLNRVYRDVPALHERDCEPDGFEWVNGSDAEHSVLTYLRKDVHGAPVLIALNFTPVVRPGYRVGVPRGGAWQKIADGDDPAYGGSGVDNPDRLVAEDIGAQGRAHSVTLTLPPLAMLAYRPEES